MNDALHFASLLLLAIGLRAAWGLARWFLTPESPGGWLVRGAVVWAVAKATGLG